MVTRGSITVGAGTVVVHQKRVLLVRLTYSDLIGRFMLPGGYVRPEETPESAAIRETAEEAGIEVEIVGLLGLRFRIERDENNTYCIFLARWIGGEPRPHGRENDAVQWFSEDELHNEPDHFVPLARYAALAGFQCSSAALPIVSEDLWPARDARSWRVYLPRTPENSSQ
ncbi:MAG: NUDIX domain-containing protein [Chloroflexi bacterium]|nr:NUDIX domain-containing protein [Chloroflexota bacterium]